MKKYLIILFFTFFSCVASARVTNCGGGTHNYQIPMGTINVDPTLKVGDVIASTTYDGMDQAIQTTFGAWYIYFKYSTKTPGAYHAIATNLDGVGVRMSQARISGSYYPYTYKGSCAGLISCSGPTPSDLALQKIELIKTADVTESGDLSDGVFAYAQCDNGQTYTNFSFGNSHIISSTCSLDTNLTNVKLGDYKTTDFSGVGSTTETKLVSIPVTCTGAGAAFSLAVSSVNVADNSNGVIALDSGGASGIGVQLLQSDGITPAPLEGTSWSAGTAATGGNSISLYARYYQLADTVTSGNADANVTLTFNYK